MREYSELDKRNSSQADIESSDRVDASDAVSELVRMVPNQFFKIKVRKQGYQGQSAYAIYFNDATNKVKAKIQKMQIREKKQERVQAESYKSTIGHELRTPLESVCLIIAALIVKLSELGLEQEQFNHFKYRLELVKSQLDMMKCFVEDLLNL